MDDRHSKYGYEIFFTGKVAKAGETKFGGQPDWIDKPNWPKCRTSNKLMKFVCQVNLSDLGIYNRVAKCAYVFIADSDQLEETWLANGGDNAVILQPSTLNKEDKSFAKGPSLYSMVKRFLFKRLRKKSFESGISLVPIVEENLNTGSFELKNKLGGRDCSFKCV